MRCKSITSWRRTLAHEHKTSPITYWGTLHINADYNMQVFRNRLRKLSNIPLIGIIEQKAKKGRPHFHFLFHSDPNKQTFRAILKSCLEGQSFRLQIETIDDVNAVIKYVTKHDHYVGRNVFQVKNFLSQKAETLRKMTPSEIKQWATHITSTDERLAQLVNNRLVSQEQLQDPCFLSYWIRAGKHDPKIALALDDAGYKTWGANFDNDDWAKSIT